jgi:hypothetical protein
MEQWNSVKNPPETKVSHREKKKRKMVVSAKSLPRGNLGRNFAEHRGTADLLQAGETDVIISTVTAGSRAPGQAKELILSRGLCAIDAEPPVRRH